MHFYWLLVFLFEPLITLETSESVTSPSQSVLPDESPSQVVAHSKKCLQFLIRLYYSCHGGEIYDTPLVTFSMFIGFGALRDMSESNLDAETIDVLHATVILCANILYNQSHNYYLAEAIFRVIKNSMPPQDVHKLREFAKLDDIDEKRERQLIKHVQSEWPINIVRISDNLDYRKLDNLLQAFKKFSVDEAGTVETSSPGPS